MINILRLDLCSPLLFAKDESIQPFVYKDWAAETLFCFTVSPDQAGRIDPDAGHFLGELLFGAWRVSDTATDARVPDTAVELPAGAYLFAQEREALSQDDWLFMAMEVQKEGLWERLKLEDKVYLRCLFEDKSAVTQVFRPYWIDTVSTM
jgi:hypothetical protein